VDSSTCLAAHATITSGGFPIGLTARSTTAPAPGRTRLPSVDTGGLEPDAKGCSWRWQAARELRSAEPTFVVLVTDARDGRLRRTARSPKS